MIAEVAVVTAVVISVVGVVELAVVVAGAVFLLLFQQWW